MLDTVITLEVLILFRQASPEPPQARLEVPIIHSTVYPSRRNLRVVRGCRSDMRMLEVGGIVELRRIWRKKALRGRST